jgi:Predicted transcriptional regulator, consists of a Zn-ribbon and ATP-cone domains
MNVQKRHTAGAQSIGFDYQFYYFVYLTLDLKQGQKIGFEVKDDIHIDKEDEATILFQTKHTVSDGNLTTLDSDLWKTLSNWTDFIKNEGKPADFLKKHSFVLITNKSENNNCFIDAVFKFKKNQEVDSIKNILNKLKSKTNSDTIKGYIENINSLTKTNLKLFFSNLSIETDTTNIIEKVKSKILETTRQDNLVDAIYDSLLANLQTAKYLEITNRNKFEISREDFDKKFGRCFKPAFENKPLPKRDFPVFLPDNLDDQIFIRQLLDIGDIESSSKEILQYTMQMLKVINHFAYWVDENFVSFTEMENFENNSTLIWANKFRSQYRQIKSKIENGMSITDFEEEIKNLGVQLIDYLREQDLSIQGYTQLDREFSNGHYYALSNNLKIGWHYDWENKYKNK